VEGIGGFTGGISLDGVGQGGGCRENKNLEQRLSGFGEAERNQGSLPVAQAGEFKGKGIGDRKAAQFRKGVIFNDTTLE